MENKNSIVVCVDFDGTCVTHDYPNVGRNIGAAPILRRLVTEGHQLVLFTMRSDMGVEKGLFKSGLSDAIDWFKDNNIPLYGVQRNPTQDSWTVSPKAYGQLYIDDAALGAPLKYDNNISDRPFIDWEIVENLLLRMGVLTDKTKQ
jgi:hypothetical protein